MRMRPCLSSFAFATTLLATSAHFSPALAQKAAVLAPLTPWAVTKVDGTADSGGAYCAMARRFKQNTILTLARNENGESSVALDFQKSALVSGENMKVVLDPGAGEQRSFYIDPISEQAFVVRLGQDHKFFDALQETGFLRIEAAGGAYTFNLADIDAGEGKLSTCLESAGGSVQEASNNGGDIEGLRREVASMRRDNQRLAKLMDSDDAARDMSQYAGDVEAQNTLMREGQRPISGMSAGQEPSGNQLMQENRRLQNAISAMRLGGEKAVAVHERIAKLEQKNMALVSDLNKTPVNSREWKKTQAKIFTLEEENKRLQDLLASKSGSMAMVGSLENQVKSLRNENSRLMQYAMNDVAPTAGNPPEVQNDGSPAPAPTDLLPPAMAEPVPLAAPAPVAPPAMPTAVDETPQQKIESLMAQMREKDAQLVELSNLKSEVETLRAKNAELEKKLMEGNQGNADVAALNERIKTLEAENAQLKQQAANNTGGGDEALKSENAALKKEVASLKAQIGKVHEEEEVKRQMEMQGLAKENMALKQRLSGGAPAVAPAPVASNDSPEEISEPLNAKAPVEPKPVDEMPVASAPPQREEPQRNAQGIQEVIVSEPGATEAQAQEAEMMNNMGQAPKTAAAPAADIQWNSPPLSAPPKAPSPQAAAPAPVAEVVPAAPAAPVETPPPAAKAPIAAPAPRPAATAFSIRDVIVSANVSGNGQMQKLDKNGDTDRTAYQWKNGSVYGSAEQRPMASAAQFDGEVSKYLDKTKNRCPGDFASKPDDSLQSGTDRVASYEIACLGKNVDTSASILFVQKDGTFSVVAHETSSTKMEEAMGLRDKVLKTLIGQ